eukprot:COSAG06_NODE_25150_length_643_cov_5.101103_1_plen_29_part_10
MLLRPSLLLRCRTPSYRRAATATAAGAGA